MRHKVKFKAELKKIEAEFFLLLNGFPRLKSPVFPYLAGEKLENLSKSINAL